LSPATGYHYRVKSKDGAGNLAVSGDFSFTTGSGDTTPPVISGVSAGSITTTGATISWTTNENSDSQVEYGTSTNYGQTTTLSTALVTAHSQGLSGLNPATGYHYRVKSKDEAGNLAVSGDFSFTTLAPANDVPLTKLKEYVYAGGRMLASEEKSCLAALDPAGASFSYTGGTGSINVTIPSECSWTAQSNAGWITVTGGQGGNGSGKVSYSVAGNSGGQRSGTITISGQAFTINQGPNPSSCSYALNKTSESVSEQSGNGSFTLTTGVGCPWTASSNAGWLSVSPTSGSGPASFSYSVQANSGGQRTGAITVGGQTLTITQAPNQASCTYSLNPSSQSFGTGGGSGSFNLTTGAGCHWDAATADGWITITGGATGTFNGTNGTVSFTVQVNNGGPRTGTITVSGHNFTVAQSGTITVYPTSYLTPSVPAYLAVTSPSNTGHGTTTNVAYNNGPTTQGKACQWSAFQSASGLIERITLKFDWSYNGSVYTDAPTAQTASATAQYSIGYSTDDGSIYGVAVNKLETSIIVFGGGEFRPFSDSGSYSTDLPLSTPISQLGVGDSSYVTASSGTGSASAEMTTTVSNIRLEVETMPVISNIAKGGINSTGAIITYPADTGKKTGMPLPPGSDSGLNALSR
ncbi:MAG: fibronectin type III domain-containing protein, partial [Blastocatellia bacterium]|nr:fibronectin type III domain-containing protein [Blastocatellia bacterium]